MMKIGIVTFQNVLQTHLRVILMKCITVNMNEKMYFTLCYVQTFFNH